MRVHSQMARVGPKVYYRHTAWTVHRKISSGKLAPVVLRSAMALDLVSPFFLPLFYFLHYTAAPRGKFIRIKTFNNTTAVLQVPCPSTEKELNLSNSGVGASGVKPVIFMVHPQYSTLFEAPRNREPQPLCKLACPETCSERSAALIRCAEKFLTEAIISREMVEHVESTQNVPCGTHTGKDESVPHLRKMCAVPVPAHLL